MSKQHNKGFALLITILLVTVLLGISSSLLNVVLKQYQLSGISNASETAFQAANAGLECALYHDFLNYPYTSTASPFDVLASPGTSGEASIGCFGGVAIADSETLTNTKSSGEEQRFEFSWPTGSASLCTKVSVYKFYSTSASVSMSTVLEIPSFPGRSCPQGAICTVIKSRGYNAACADITTNPRVVERELIKVY